MTETDGSVHVRETIWTLLCATIIGLCFVALRFLVVFRADGKKATGLVFIALMWALAWLVSGFLLGFLFGIPKTPKNSDESDNKEVPYRLRVNTNLEEISDWLTKILVGATLTQLVNVPSKVKAIGQFMAEGGGGIGSQAFAVSILVYFSSLGFFAGYVLTRMFFQVAFVRADSKLSQGDVRTLRNAGPSLDPKDQPDANALGIAEKTRGIPITESLTAEVAGAVATGAILMGDTPRAVQAAKIAVEKNPGEARAHLNYAIALYRSNPASDLVKIELEKAHEIVTRNADATITEDICNSIVYFYLYVIPPEGFTKAIEYGEDYLKNNTPSRASIWINMACAYAQQYAYMQSTDGTSDPKQLEPVKNKAFQAVRNALSISPKTAARFRQLATGRPDPEDDDLKIFASDEQFKRMIGLG